jgi:hypothetical protein
MPSSRPSTCWSLTGSTIGRSRSAGARIAWRGCCPRAGRDRAHEHTDARGELVFRQACTMGLEGIVSKRLTAPYTSGPSRDWIKIKNPLDLPAG